MMLDGDRIAFLKITNWLLIGLIVMLFIVGSSWSTQIEQHCDKYRELDEKYFVVPETMEIKRRSDFTLQESLKLISKHDEVRQAEFAQKDFYGYANWFHLFREMSKLCDS